MSFARNILIFYLLIAIIGALLLWAPFSQTNHLSWDPLTNSYEKGYLKFTDALFLSASAFSDTGLSTHSSAVVFNQFGQAIIATLIFIGGIGFFALKVYIFNIILGRPISYRTRTTLSAERGSVKVGVTKMVIAVAVSILLVLILIFSVVLSFIFYNTDVSSTSTKVYNSINDLTGVSNANLIHENPYHNSLTAIRFGVFHTISAINNAGFDIIGGHSLVPYYHIVSIQIMFLVLFVIGGLGFPVLYDIFMYCYSKVHGNKYPFRFSLFTKLSCATYLAIAVVSIGITFILETQYQSGEDHSIWNGSEGVYGTKGEKSLALIFNTMSTRNAGFTTVNTDYFSPGTQMLFVIMMFIGSAPSSTAGGIRTTTFAIILLGLWSVIRGKKHTYVFGMQIQKDTVKRSYAVFTVSIMLLVLGSLISMTSLDVFGGKIPTVADHPHAKVTYDFQDIFFEVTSAFGTTGLSTGITSDLSFASKIAIILIMFAGQLGISSSILIWGSQKITDNKSIRVSKDVTIG